MSILLINSGPGTGKTFTLNMGYRKLSYQITGLLEPTDEQAAVFDYLKSEFGSIPSPKVCFFAHNNSTKDELTRRLPPKTKVQTFHGAGLAAIIARHRFQRRDASRAEKLISDMTGKWISDMPNDEKFAWLATKRYVHYLKLENMFPSQQSLDYIRMKYPDMSVYSIPEDWHDRASRLFDKASIVNGTVDFDDMLRLGMLSVKKPLYDIGFVDESQDINKCAYELIIRLCKNVVFCGDKNQAINAFAGASEEMYDNISNVSDAILPLKMTLRCPPFICDMANALRKGGILPGPNQENGIHETIDYSSLPEVLQRAAPKNSLIISRTNAAVISCALLLHRNDIPCRIIDKDLADEVRYFFAGFHTKSIPKLLSAVEAYEAKGARSKNPMWAQMCLDKSAYAKDLLASVSTWDQLVELINATFEKHPDGYKLSSIHKSKGLEAENIFILNPPVELSVAMNHPVAKEQEINLHFVAVTRCAKNLYWVVKQ